MKLLKILFEHCCRTMFHSIAVLAHFNWSESIVYFLGNYNHYSATLHDQPTRSHGTSSCSTLYSFTNTQRLEYFSKSANLHYVYLQQTCISVKLQISTMFTCNKICLSLYFIFICLCCIETVEIC